MLDIGSLVDGKYKILNKIGQGGMSVVYLAMNERANKQWAIKEVRKDGIQNFDVVKQGLIVETDMLKKLNHPNLPSIIDVIDEEGRFLIVMDYIQGVPLSNALKESPSGTVSQELVIEWAKQLCDVLGYLHSRTPAIIYRDMKPSNVMLKPDGNVVLIDFGTAREFKENKVEDTSVLGTAGYAAPEQYGGHGQTDARTDIFCLGATLYHLLTGQNPCQYQYGIFPFQEYPIRHWNAQLSSGLEAIIMKCTARLPDDRYQSCAQLLYALEHYDELDEDYKKKQNRKLGGFIASSAICVLAAAASIGCNIASAQVTNSSYDSYISEAESDSASPTDEDKIELLESAISIDPSRAEGYFDLLNGYDENSGFQGVFLADGVLTSEEDEILRGILNDVSATGTQSNKATFQKNTAEYERFAYELGIAYYYYYEEASAAKSYAREWLEIAAASTNLSSAEIERASKLSQIAGYYSQIGIESVSGDTSVSYSDYWYDLISLAEGNLVEATENKMTALAVYQELATQIYNNTSKFKNAGITEAQMTEQLDNIESRLQTDIIIDDANNQQMTVEMMEKVQTTVDQARTQVAITFGTGGGM